MGKAPDAPDPYATANAQTASNVTTAQTQAGLNAVDTTNPYGSTTYTRGANGAPTSATSTLNPALQGLLTGQEGLMSLGQGAGNSLMSSLDTGAITPYQKTQFDPSSVNDPATNQAWQGQLALLKPQMDLQNNALNEQMASRGLPIGSEASNSATHQLQATQDAALTNAASTAQQTGFNQGLSGATFSAGQNNQAFANEVTGAQVPYSNLATLLSALNPSSMLGQAPSTATKATTVSPTDVTGAVYNSANLANQQYQQNMGSATQLASGLGSLLMFSDKNMKEDRRPADGEASLMRIAALPIDHYKYKKSAQRDYGVPERRTGPMAQDVAKHFGPEASDGHVVDLADMAGHMMAAIGALEQRTQGLTAER